MSRLGRPGLSRPGLRRPGLRRTAAWLLAIVLAAGPVRAEAPSSPVAVRYGDHPGFGRIVFDGDGSAGAAIERNGDRLMVRLGTASLLPGAAAPRNVVSVTSAAGSVTIDLLEKAGIRRMAVNNHLVIDVLDPAVPPAAASARVVAAAPSVPIILRSRPERRPDPNPHRRRPSSGSRLRHPKRPL